MQCRIHKQVCIYQHSVSNSPKTPTSKKFPCGLCPKQFTRRYALREHLRAHTDERPFVCGVCGKAFARHRDCQRHERQHSNGKQFVCRGTLENGNSWGCGRGFARADALGAHFRCEQGRSCIKPLLEFEAEKNRDSQLSSIKSLVITSMTEDNELDIPGPASSDTASSLRNPSVTPLLQPASGIPTSFTSPAANAALDQDPHRSSNKCKCPYHLCSNPDSLYQDLGSLYKHIRNAHRAMLPGTSATFSTRYKPLMVASFLYMTNIL